MPKVVIFVPDIMGSELRLGDEVVWPGTVEELFRGYKRMDMLLHPDLLPTDVVRRYHHLSRQYETLIDDLTHWGFHEDASPANLEVFPYDWRKSLAEAAFSLSVKIQLTAGRHPEDTSIVLLAHGMG